MVRCERTLQTKDIVSLGIHFQMIRFLANKAVPKAASATHRQPIWYIHNSINKSFLG